MKIRKKRLRPCADAATMPVAAVHDKHREYLGLESKAHNVGNQPTATPLTVGCIEMLEAADPFSPL